MARWTSATRPAYTLAALVLVAAGCAQPDAPTPADTVVALYRTLALGQVRGAPSGDELASIAPYVSSELHDRLAAARRLQERETARAPEEKPPYADGDLFTSLFEGPTSFQILSDTARGDERAVAVRFNYDRAQPGVAWTDVVVVRSERGRWVVADVIYGGQWDFANRGTLLTALEPATRAGS
jgi:hypothetical protein